MTTIQKKIIELLIQNLPENLERKIKYKKSDELLALLKKGNYIGNNDADINTVCNAVLFTMENPDTGKLNEYFSNILDKEKDHFFRSIRTVTENILHEEIINFITSHSLISINGLESQIEAPKGTIALAISKLERKIPAKYFSSLIVVLNKYGFKSEVYN